MVQDGNIKTKKDMIRIRRNGRKEVVPIEKLNLQPFQITELLVKGSTVNDNGEIIDLIEEYTDGGDNGNVIEKVKSISPIDFTVKWFKWASVISLILLTLSPLGWREDAVWISLKLLMLNSGALAAILILREVK